MSNQKPTLIPTITMLINEINDDKQLETFFEWFENESNQNRICFTESENIELLKAFTNANNRLSLESG